VKISASKALDHHTAALGGLSRLSAERLADGFAKRLGFFARASGRVDEAHARQGQFRQSLRPPKEFKAWTDH
jgi:hypothetical protein